MKRVPGPHCSICSTPVRQPAVSCAACFVLYHPECWKTTRQCAIYGCGWTDDRPEPAVAFTLSTAACWIAAVLLLSVLMLIGASVHYRTTENAYQTPAITQQVTVPLREYKRIDISYPPDAPSKHPVNWWREWAGADRAPPPAQIDRRP